MYLPSAFASSAPNITFETATPTHTHIEQTRKCSWGLE